MKIINRLYLQVILVALLLIAVILSIYRLQTRYEQKVQEESLALKAAKQKLQNCNTLIKKCHQQKRPLKEKSIQKKVLKKDPQPKLAAKRTNPVGPNPYKIRLMRTLHHQIEQELHYAPYLPLTQLQQSMEERFPWSRFSISIANYEGKPFEGIKISNETTASLIRDNQLLEVHFAHN